MNKYNVYIDESGDEGLQRGSKYFILTAIIVDDTLDLNILKSVDAIKEELEIKKTSQLHWNKIKGNPNKMMIMNKVAGLDIVIINIVINTDEIRMIHSSDIYNHFSGYLYERICQFAKNNNGVANINVSSRGSNLTKNNLIDFLKKKHKKYCIDYRLINDIKIYPNSQKKLLQLADCCCSALGQALKFNEDKYYKYIYTIKDKYYTEKGKYLGNGLKYVPGNVKNDANFNCLLKYLDNKKSELSSD